MSDVAQNPALTSEASARDYISLLKPKVMSLVVFTGFSGMAVAPGFSDLHPLIAAIAMLCLAVNAGAAGAINMWYDRDIDAIMKRTMNRPVPAGKIPAEEALSFGVVLTLLSIMTMGLAVNWTAASLLAVANGFYVFIYTMWLKRSTPQNIVIGGAAGAFPPMIGWAAVTGDVSLASISLFAVIFFWTPPHFWALALFANKDYKRAGIPMLPCVAGARTTHIHMFIYTLILVPVTLAPYVLGIAGLAYGGTALALGTFFIYSCLRVMREKNEKSARLMFGYSVFYLFALFLTLMLDSAA